MGLGIQTLFRQTGKALIRLGRWHTQADLSSLGAQVILLVLTCSDSFNLMFQHNWYPVLTSSFLVTTVRAVGSRLDAERTSLSCASFFSSVSARAPSFFSSNRFLKLLFCWTSCIALTNFLYSSSLSSCVWENMEHCEIFEFYFFYIYL